MAKTSWRDLEVLGRRNNKIIKYMETLLFKVKKDDPDTIVHYATSIGNLSRQNIEIIKLVDRYEEINTHYSEVEKEKRQQEATARKWRRKAEKIGRQELESEINRAKYQAGERW